MRLFSSASASTTESVTIDLEPVGLVEEGVGLRIGALRAEVAAHPVAQHARLAHVDRLACPVEVQVDPGLLGQPRDLVLEVGDGHGPECVPGGSRDAAARPFERRLSGGPRRPVRLARLRSVSSAALLDYTGRQPPSAASVMTFTGLIGAICMFPLRAIIRVCVVLRIHPNVLTFDRRRHQRRGRVGPGARPLRAGRASS